MKQVKLWVVAAAGILVVWQQTVGGMDATTRWDRLSGRSFMGKPASSVLLEGPPPRLRTGKRMSAGGAGIFYLYADHNSLLNHFRPTGYMGDRQDLRIDENSSEDPADGPTCIKIAYSPSRHGKQGWAGLYWLDPRANWRGRRGGFNLVGMTRLTFWARGARGGEHIALFKVGGISDSGDNDNVATLGPVWLTREWQQYTIELADMDLSRVTGGFAWSSDGTDNIGPVVFYLDEIRYER